jgi:hypothetical protein
MELLELSALMRAVAALHPQGAIDQDLIGALSHLIAPKRDGVKKAQPIQPESRGISPHRPGVSAPSRGATRSDDRAQPSPIHHRDRGDRAKGSRRTKDDTDELIAIETVLELIVEQAGLVPEQHDSTSRDRAQRTRYPEERIAPTPVEALFPPGRVRAVLREMTTVPTPTGPPDLRKAVRRIAQGEPILEVPRTLVNTLPQSIHWLFEAGPSMLPYARDKQQLARTVTRLLGEDRVHLADFIADPLKGIRARGQVKWRPLRWPGPRSALVIVTDLGIGGGESVDAFATAVWASLLAQAAQRGVSTVLLNPYGHDRWPSVAHGFDIALTWDAGTGVQTLRRSWRTSRGH